MAETDHLFVYGTLRRQSPHPMAVWLRSCAAWIGEAIMPGTLYDCGSYPVAVAGSRLVLGDLYRLRDPQPALARLDDYEGCAGTSDDLYRRLTATVRLLGNERQERNAMTYLAMAAPHGARAIPGGDWLAHLSARGPVVRANASR